MTMFVWAGKPPRLAKCILYLHLCRRPSDAQLSHILLGGSSGHSQMVVFPDQTEPGSETGGGYTRVLAFRGAKAPHDLTIPMKTLRVWKEARAVFCKPNCESPHTPLWVNSTLPHLYDILDPSYWAGWGITTLKHVIRDGHLMPFAELKRAYSLSNSSEFRFWQLRRAMKAQFLVALTLESDSIECLLISSIMGTPLSTLYA